MDFQYVFYLMLQSQYSDHMDLGQPKIVSDDSMSDSPDDVPQLDPLVCISFCVIELVS